MSTTIRTMLLLFLLFIINSLSEENICRKKSDGFHRHFDCHSFYSCRNETLNQIFQCSDPSTPIFSSYRQRCVKKNLLYNECYLTNLTINPNNCAWFSIQLSTNINFTYHYSCFYPFLFNRQTKECQHYSQVQCDERFEPKDACDYYHPQMHHPVNEQPCWLIPSCRNQSNGLHGNHLQECSTYYECQDERFIRSIICPNHTRFSETSKTCLPSLINCENTTVS